MFRAHRYIFIQQVRFGKLLPEYITAIMYESSPGVRYVSMHGREGSYSRRPNGWSVELSIRKSVYVHAQTGGRCRSLPGAGSCAIMCTAVTRWMTSFNLKY